MVANQTHIKAQRSIRIICDAKKMQTITSKGTYRIILPIYQQFVAVNFHYYTIDADLLNAIY